MFHVKLERKADHDGRPCYLLGPAKNYPGDTVRVLDESRGVMTTRDVLWLHYSLAPTLTAPAPASAPVTDQGGVEQQKGSDAAQESYSRSCGCSCRCSGARGRREIAEPPGDAVTPEPGAEAGNGDAADHGDSDGENGMEETKKGLPPASPTVEPSLTESEPDSPVVEPDSPAVEPDSLAVEPDSPAVEPEPPAADEPDLPAEDPAEPEDLQLKLLRQEPRRGNLRLISWGRRMTSLGGLAVLACRSEQDSSSVVRDNAFEVVRKPPLLVGRMGDSGDGRVERDLEDGTQAFPALLAEDQSNLQPDGPIVEPPDLDTPH